MTCPLCLRISALNPHSFLQFDSQLPFTDFHLVDPVNYPALSIRDVVTCSLGVSTLRRDIRRDERLRVGDFVAVKNELMRRADTRMYLAKDRGRNRIVADGEESSC